ncbi:MAG TPA: hypothetical protein V6D12_05560 [Candidatus Obscuribacterales bacterium]
MYNKILLTSFNIWLPHHKSNSSDDLLEELTKINKVGQSSLGVEASEINPKSKIQNPKFHDSLVFLRRLPVDVKLASDRVKSKINGLQPDLIICCGMAESRTQLTVESKATCGNAVINTPVDLEKLVTGLAGTEISHDAGKFVCEGLYYSILEYIRDRNLKTRCIFLHVPLLKPNNLAEIIADFQLIIQRMAFDDQKL